MPSDVTLSMGTLQQGPWCLDTMGHLSSGTVGIYPCHNSGGNQVCISFYDNLLESRKCDNHDSNINYWL